jgi:hypothetical protein
MHCNFQSYSTNDTRGWGQVILTRIECVQWMRFMFFFMFYLFSWRVQKLRINSGETWNVAWDICNVQLISVRAKTSIFWLSCLLCKPKLFVLEMGPQVTKLHFWSKLTSRNWGAQLSTVWASRNSLIMHFCSLPFIQYLQTRCVVASGSWQADVDCLLL